MKKKHPFHLDRHTHHHAKVVDTADYRADAAAFFAKVKDLPVEERCPELKRMTLDQVHQQWHKYLAETDNNARKLSGKKKQEAFYDLHFSFNDMLAETPVLVTGHVPKQLGWQAATHWGCLAATCGSFVQVREQLARCRLCRLKTGLLS